MQTCCTFFAFYVFSYANCIGTAPPREIVLGKKGHLRAAERNSVDIERTFKRTGRCAGADAIEGLTMLCSLRLIAVAHLAYAIGDTSDIGAEFGVSVLSHARGRGLGARLFDHAARSARNRNITQIGMHALSENAPMIKIATDAGARVERHGSESEAYLQLTAQSIRNRLAEYAGEHLALADFRIKLRVVRGPCFSVKPEMRRH